MFHSMVYNPKTEKTKDILVMDIHTQHHFRPFNSDGSHHEIPCLLNILHALSRMNEIRSNDLQVSSTRDIL